MKINATRFYSGIFISVLLLQLYLPSFKANIAVQIVALLLYLVIEKVSFSVSFYKQVLPFVYILLVGFIGTIIYKFETYNIIKDIVHFLKPLTGILIGYFYFRRINDFKHFVLTIVIAAVISAFIHFFIIGLLVDTSSGSLDRIRFLTKDNFLELFAIFFIVCYKKYQKEPLFKNQLLTYAIQALLIISSILYFSRTMIVVAVLLFLSMYGYTRLTRKTITVIAVLMLAVGLLYTYLHTATIRRGKPGIEGFLYKIKIAPQEVFVTRVSRDNRSRLWDHWRGYEASRAIALMKEHPSSYFFGVGHGSLVNLRFFAPLTGEKKGIRYISELHNGYMYISYKTGFIGLLIYLLILGRWYFKINRTLNFLTVSISAIAIIYIVTTLTITGMYNKRDVIIFLLGALLFFDERKKGSSLPLLSSTSLGRI